MARRNKGLNKMKYENDKFEGRDRKRDRDGVQAKRKQARKAKQSRREFEGGHATKNDK